MKEKKQRKLTEEHKRKIGLANSGRTYSKEHKQRLSVLRKGKKPSIETRRRMSVAHKGKVFSEETKKKISLALTGKKLTDKTKAKLRIINLGKIVSEETRRKQSESMKKNLPRTAFKKGIIPWNKGKKTGLVSWSYIDGRSKTKSPDRYGPDWPNIRLLIYKRDNYQCQDCGITMNELGKPLDVHHKVPFLISFDNSFSNLIALCRSCHMKWEHKLAVLRKQLNQGLIND